MDAFVCSREEALAWLRLALVPGVSCRQQRELLRIFGSPHAALAQEPEALMPLLGPSAAAALARGPAPTLVERTLRWLEAADHHLVALGSSNYPRRVLEVWEPPTVLYVEGRLDLMNVPAFAVVGSRNGSSLGRRDARMLATRFSSEGLCVVSGLALGIDAAAHRGGLDARGSSIAVLGTGIDVHYPRSNEALADELRQKGAIVSEFPLGTPPLPGNFLRRNRLISGMSLGVLVVEAGMQSGTLSTANHAIEQGRDVFALPGSVHSPLAKGCHALIKAGAMLAECAEDILEGIGWKNRDSPPGTSPLFEASKHPLLEAMGDAPASVDELATRLALAAAQVARELSRFELEGRVASLPGGRFQRVIE